MLDWVASRIEVLFGITDTVFSEAVSVSVEGEPVALDLSARVPGRRATLAVAVPERGEVLTMGVDATGELVHHETLALRGAATGVAFAEVTGDGTDDLLVGGEQRLAVFSGLARMQFSAPAEFSIPTDEGLWAVADIDRDGAPDLVAADRQSRRLLVLGSARRGPSIRWPDAYAVGRQPRQAQAADVNGDGRDDLVIANLKSGSLSVLVNRGDGTFGGQHCYALPDGPTGLTTLAGVERGTVFVLASHASSDQISVVEIPQGDLTKSELIVIGTGSQPRIQYAAVARTPAQLRMLVRSNADGGPGAVALSLFEQLRGDQFLERQFSARFPRRITAMAAGEFQGSGAPDLVLATYDRTKQRTTLSLAPSRGSLEFTTVEPILVFGDSLRGVRDLMAADIDGEGTVDLLVVPDAPRTRLGVVRGARGLSANLLWINDVYPSRDIPPIVRDVTGDGRADIVLLDELRGAVVMLRGAGGGGFEAPREIAPGSGVNGMAVGAFRAAGSADLALTFGDQGIVTLLFETFAK